MNTNQSATAEGSVEDRLGPAIREAAERTMTQICDRPPRISEEPTPLDGEGISAAIDCDGDTCFTLVLCLPKETTSPLMKTFTGVPIGWDADVLHDVSGELLNVLAGDIVAELSEQGVQVRMSLPRVERTLDLNGLVPGASVVADFGLTDVHGVYRLAIVRAGSSA